MILLDGKSLSQIISEDLKNKVSMINEAPSLVVIQIGNNQISNIYINVKRKFGESIGIPVLVHKFAEDTTTEAVIEMINYCNIDNSVGGIIVQLPLPQHIDKYTLLNAIDPKKDVDGLGIINSGKLLKKDFSGKVPATPKGVITLLKHYEIKIEGKNVVVVGRSQLVGMPLSLLLSHENATVTIAHSKTENLQDITSQADILITAIGVPHLIKKDYVKKGAVVVDVGNSKPEDKILGDVDFEDLKEIVSAITPVPGGVGPMTVASLFQNLLS